MFESIGVPILFLLTLFSFRINASVKSEFYLQTAHKFRTMHQKMEYKVNLLMLCSYLPFVYAERCTRYVRTVADRTLKCCACVCCMHIECGNVFSTLCASERIMILQIFFGIRIEVDLTQTHSQSADVLDTHFIPQIQTNGKFKLAMHFCFLHSDIDFSHQTFWQVCRIIAQILFYRFTCNGLPELCAFRYAFCVLQKKKNP